MNPITLLKTKQGKQSIREFAKVIGVSHAYLAYVLKGQRPPGPKVLKFLNLERVVVRSKPLERTVIYREMA